MSQDDTYGIEGSVEFLVEQAIVDSLVVYNDLLSVFADTAINVRRYKEGDKSDLSLPAQSVQCISEQSLPLTNEYHFRIQIFCNTKQYDDEDGQMVEALAGCIRNWLHRDTSADYSGHFAGDCRGVLEDLNETARDLVFHKVHEIGTERADEDARKMNSKVVFIDAWGYPGRTKE